MLTVVSFAATACIAPTPGGAPASGVGKADNDSGALPVHRVLAAAEDGQPLFVEGTLAQGEPEAFAVARRLFRLDKTRSRFEPVRDRVDALGNRHVYYAQSARLGPDAGDLHPVRGGDLTLHFDRDGVAYAATSTARSLADMPSQPRIGRRAATDAAMTWAAAQRIVDLDVKPSSESLVVLIPESGRVHLAFEIPVRGTRLPERRGTPEEPIDDLIYVDAIDGQIVDMEPQFHGVLDRRIHDANGGRALPGQPARFEGDGPTGDTRVDDAFDHIGEAYETFTEIAGRAPFGSEQTTLLATVGYRRNQVGAWWNGSQGQLVFGDGDGIIAKCMASALDIVCHELAHAVTERTAGLKFRGESGAISESVSDVLGAACELQRHKDRGDTLTEEDWEGILEIGEGVWLAGQAMRFMDDPARDGRSIDHYSRYRDLGAHSTSGIGNLAFSLMVRGGEHPRAEDGVAKTAPVPPLSGVFLFDTEHELEPRAIEGWELATRIFYRALARYLTPNSNYAMLRAATLRATTDLGYAREYATVAAAWEAVGVHGEVPELAPGEGVSDLRGDPRTPRPFTFEVPPTATALRLTLSGEGHGEVWARPALPLSPLDPGEDAGDATFVAPFADTEQTLVIPHPEPGTWHLLVRGRVGGYEHGRLEVTLDEVPSCAKDGAGPASPPPLPERTLLCPDAAGAAFDFVVHVPDGHPGFVVRLEPEGEPDLFADIDLYARRGAPADADRHDRQSAEPGAEERLLVGPDPGDWYVRVETTHPPAAPVHYALTRAALE